MQSTATAVKPISRRLTIGLARHLEYRKGDRWTRDEVRVLVRTGLLTPDAADRWHRRRFGRPFIELSSIGVTALQSHLWPYILAVLYVAYGGDEAAVAREWVAFNEWGRSLWNAKRRRDQVMSLDEAEAIVKAAVKKPDGLMLYERTAGGAELVSWSKLAEFHQVEPWRAQIIKVYDPELAVFPDQSIKTYRGVTVDAATVKQMVRPDERAGTRPHVEPTTSVTNHMLVNIDASQTLHDNRSFNLNPTTVISAVPEAADPQSGELIKSDPALEGIDWDEKRPAPAAVGRPSLAYLYIGEHDRRWRLGIYHGVEKEARYLREYVIEEDRAGRQVVPRGKCPSIPAIQTNIRNRRNELKKT